ncbi:hypothetical protein PAXINDRAFT_14576 [Paxillus involutus ATCC 200175]|uniref:DUF6534 domain-containing protein n=1 Tax=Paxillus involutus ATCC 200175 TaxID=664439 RepID=A0A0C9TYR2_PAXIN|nr:hypothetical protein PAXINDRAFT_14576 [Paxillus involutus ATCC 200175]
MAGVDGTWGGGFVGLVVGSILYGVTIAQTYFYYDTYTNDPFFLKAIVAILCVLDTAHTALISHLVYFYLITEYGTPTMGIIWTLPAQVFITAMIGFIVQCSMMYRVWSMNRTYLRWILTVPTLIMASFSLATGYAYAVKLVEIKVLARIPEILVLIEMALGTAAAVDIMYDVQVPMLLFLKYGTFYRSDSMINRLIVYTVNNGLLTSLCALLDVIIHSTLPPTSFAFLAFYFLLSKLYCNTFLSMLNARRSLRRRGQSPNDAALALTFGRTGGARDGPRGAEVASSAPGPTVFDQTSSEHWKIDG